MAWAPGKVVEQGAQQAGERRAAVGEDTPAAVDRLPDKGTAAGAENCFEASVERAGCKLVEVAGLRAPGRQVLQGLLPLLQRID